MYTEYIYARSGRCRVQMEKKFTAQNDGYAYSSLTGSLAEWKMRDMTYDHDHDIKPET